MDGMSDMGGMDMGGDGMDMSSSGSGMFQPENMALARSYWYLICAVVGFLALLRIWEHIQARLSIRKIRSAPDATPSRPSNIFSQSFATTTALLREVSYWQPWNFEGRFTKYFTPPSAGRCFILMSYWVVLLTMIWTGTVMKPDDPNYAYKWEKVGFRAAWMSVTQVPFVYLLATKLNPVSLLSGISYERLNWFHRWASRTLFITVIFHWSYFFTEWSLADFVAFELEMMPMVIWGFAAWGVIGFMVLSSFGFFRSMCYELWVLQHIASGGILLWLLHRHVPSYAAYNIWMAVAFIAFDQIGRMAWNLAQNIVVRRGDSSRFNIGYTASLEALPNEFTRIRIENVRFKWKAGQHVYISLPSLGPIELHPFTIANHCEVEQNSLPTLTLLVKAQSGFSRRLHKRAQQSPNPPLKAFLSGPWGNPPNLSIYETIVLVANSTGITYTLPLLQALAQNTTCARHVSFSWICKESGQISWLQKEVLAACEQLVANGVTVTLHIGCTDGSKQLCHPVLTEDSSSSPSLDEKRPKDPHIHVTATNEPQSDPESGRVSPDEDCGFLPGTCICTLRNYPTTKFTYARRPSLDGIIRPAVEGAFGETAVICCGRQSLMSDVRNYVVRLSDDRAVHKGTGAQGIFLWCEEYHW